MLSNFSFVVKPISAKNEELKNFSYSLFLQKKEQGLQHGKNQPHQRNKKHDNQIHSQNNPDRFISLSALFFVPVSRPPARLVFFCTALFRKLVRSLHRLLGRCLKLLRPIVVQAVGLSFRMTFIQIISHIYHFRFPDPLAAARTKMTDLDFPVADGTESFDHTSTSCSALLQNGSTSVLFSDSTIAEEKLFVNKKRKIFHPFPPYRFPATIRPTGQKRILTVPARIRFRVSAECSRLCFIYFRKAPNSTDAMISTIPPPRREES